MFNYNNLNDVEFEELCKDIMEKLLGKELRIFAKGRDGGIDLTDNVITHNIIIQAKHYINSSFSNLKSSLNKELINVKRLKPKQYYICCGMNLTDKNINEVFNIFTDFMESDKNIITLKEIDELLQKEENSEIVRKHYKLWLYASNILNEIYNQNIFIDCESLLSDIREECKYFVQTSSYIDCLKYLESNRLILMIGSPGVGKTITSKMLVLFFANQGYRVRYTTNGDIDNIKRALSTDKSTKEIILLDDCLGQHYFNMKSSQEIELISLIKYIKLNSNKMLILNSRITIYNEAKERSEEFHTFIEGQKIIIHTINMNLITSLEKARIFYNHLKYKKVPKDYYCDIRKDKRYLFLVNHKNYTPRIIEYVTMESRYLTVSPENYYDFIREKLNYPDDIWKNEFERRIKDIDRAFMTTLYSLTETTVDYEVLKNSFNNRLKLMNNLDKTLDNFEMTMNRLNGSFISIFDYKGSRHIGVINPSVNDYIKTIFLSNKLELSEIRESALYYIQIKRCYQEDDYEVKIKQVINDGSILELKFDDEFQKVQFIVSRICKYSILNKVYSDVITRYFSIINRKGTVLGDTLSCCDIIKCLFNEKLYSFYVSA